MTTGLQLELLPLSSGPEVAVVVWWDAGLQNLSMLGACPMAVGLGLLVHCVCLKMGLQLLGKCGIQPC